MTETNTQLPLRKLGNTDIDISALGLGTWQFSGGSGLIGGYFDALDSELTMQIVKAAVDGGINWFDTAQAYGSGESERNLAKAIKAAGIDNEDIRIATKWWPVLKTAKNLKTTIDDRLECLGGYAIDHYIVHQPYSLSSVTAQMHAMADLMDSGKIRSVGVSNFSAMAMKKAHEVLVSRGYALASNQVHYSLLSRDIEKNGMLDTAKQLGISIIAYSPLDQGMLTGRLHESFIIDSNTPWLRKQSIKIQARKLEKSRPLIELMKEIGGAHNATISQVALNYLITAHGDTVVAIPGASKISQLKQNLGALNFRLANEEKNALRSAADKI
jgi:aryl-alcohol dehydrogenase-like predicted oxidoreductase